MVLINVRLDEEDARRAKALRGVGVQLSALVRDAIRAEYERRIGRARSGKPSELLAEILAALPDPVDLPARRVDASDRAAVRRHVAAKLKRKRP